MKSAATDATTFPVATSCTSHGGTRFRKHGSVVLGKDRHSDHHATRSGDGTWSVGRQLDFAVTCTRAPVDRSEPESEFETEPASVSGDGVASEPQQVTFKLIFAYQAVEEAATRLSELVCANDLTVKGGGAERIELISKSEGVSNNAPRGSFLFTQHGLQLRGQLFVGDNSTLGQDVGQQCAEVCIDCVGAPCYAMQLKEGFDKLEGVHSILFKLGRRLFTCFSPERVSQHISALPEGVPLAVDALRGTFHEDIQKTFQNDNELKFKMEVLLALSDTKYLQEVLDQHISDAGLQHACQRSSCGFSRWDMPHDKILPQLALYDQLLARKLHCARGLAVATLVEGAAAADNVICFSDNGASALPQPELPLCPKRVNLWWDTRFSVSYDRTCARHSLHVNYHPAKSPWACARRLATFARSMQTALRDKAPEKGSLPSATSGDSASETLGNTKAETKAKTKPDDCNVAAYVLQQFLHATDSSVEQRALLELLLAPCIVKPADRRAYTYVWQLHWQIVWLQTHAPKDVPTSDTEKEDIALRYRLFCSTLQRHVAMPLYYVHDVFSVLMQDVLLRKAVGQAVYDYTILFNHTRHSVTAYAHFLMSTKWPNCSCMSLPCSQTQKVSSFASQLRCRKHRTVLE